MANFKEVKVVDNFYQNSLFFPMPTVAISTLDEEGRTTIDFLNCQVYISLVFVMNRYIGIQNHHP